MRSLCFTQLFVRASSVLVAATLGGSAFSSQPDPDASTGASQPASGVIAFTPYNARPRELDLWRIESRKWLRSDAVVSPDRACMAYSEISFIPDARQTIAALYVVTLASPTSESRHESLPDSAPAGALASASSANLSAPPAAPRRGMRPRFWWPSASSSSASPGFSSGSASGGRVDSHAPSAAEIALASRYEPALTLSQREAIFKAGFSRTRPYRFETLTVVDWSASGRRLLFKRRSGVLYYGLKTTDILLYDGNRRVVSVYGDLQRAIRAYWQDQQASHDLDSAAVSAAPVWNDAQWDLLPLGFRPGSEHLAIVEATAFTPTARVFWGVWELDLDQRRVRLLSRDNTPPPVGANGVLARVPIVYDPQTAQWRYRDAR
ncbi:MAG: hypothetical protein IPK79_07310 [Vampirovibrionales bacterium]|nr:hypothetical protein [Vampirovibrionales bacterium]